VRDENQVEKVTEKTRQRVGGKVGTTQSFFHLTEKKLRLFRFRLTVRKSLAHVITHHIFCFFFLKENKGQV